MSLEQQLAEEAQDHLRAGRRAEAATSARQALGQIGARRVLAWLALQQGELAEAQAQVEAGLALDRDDADACFMAGCLAELDALKAEAPEERSAALEAAERALRRAVEGEPVLLPLGARVLVRLATVRLLQGRLTAAGNGFEAAIERDPDSREAPLGLAEIRLAEGHPEAALRLVEPLLDDRPDGWILAALAAERADQVDQARQLAARAERALSGGLLSPHRRERWDDLQALLAVHTGEDRPLRGPLGQIAAFMTGRFEPIGGARARPLQQPAMVALLARLLARGKVEPIVMLTDARAQTLVPGLGDAVAESMRQLGGASG